MIYVCDEIEKIGEAELASFYRTLGLQIQRKADAFRKEINKRQLLVSRMLLLAGLREEYGLPLLPDMEISRYGKPYFFDARQIYFNISHSDTCAAVAISSEQVGIDVEKIQDTYDKRVAERVYTDKENRLIRNARDFYRFWTIKESYIKAVGKGLSIPLQEIEFDNTEDSFSKYGFYFTLKTIGSFSLCVCSADKEPLQLKTVSAFGCVSR